jgi:uncharacterized protein
MAASENDRRIDYIEFTVGDIERARTFYGAAFGWRFTDYGPDYCAFDDGRLAGGFAKGDGANPGGPLVILYADDLAGTQRRIEQAGGRITRPIFPFPGGQRFHFHDPDGYELAVWSDK